MMKFPPSPNISRLTICVIIISFAISLALAVSAWNINYWPTDAEDYYLDAARQLAHARFVSEIHQGIDAEKVRWAHGKEFFFVLISIFQRLVNDFQSLRPVILVGVISIFFAAVFLYLIARQYWGEQNALLCWFLFAAGAWPYMYVLMAKHQPTGLALFLGAVLTLFPAERKGRKCFFFFLSGVLFGTALFTSTVSSLYLLYYIGAFGYQLKRKRGEENIPLGRIAQENVIPALLVVLGLTLPFLYINLPNIAHNIKSYWEYVHISGKYNHFYYNQPFLQQWFPNMPVADIRGGWLWIFKYFLTIMPVLFPLYLAGVTYLIIQMILRKDRPFILKATGVILLSVSAPVMAETVRAAQYGSNYFPALSGIIFLIGFVWHDLEISGYTRQPWIKGGVAAVLLIHFIANAAMFSFDIYPCRMSKTFLSRELKKRDIRRLSTYLFSPHRNAFIPCLSPKVLEKLTFNPIRTLAEAGEGYILLPPVTGDSLYVAATSPYIHFDQDLILNALIAKGKLDDYAVVSFPTLANSRFWVHEEEILSYRRLILNQDFEDNAALGRVWLLDAAKLRKDIGYYLPLPDDLKLMQEGVRRIGTKRKFLIYRGTMTREDRGMMLKEIAADIRLRGSPRDALIAYVYEVGKKQPVWIPAGERFFSRALPAAGIKNGKAVFHFDPPLAIHAGRHYVAIYRTGEPNDRVFYTIDIKSLSLH